MIVKFEAWKQLRNNYSLFPIIIVTGFGLTVFGSMLYHTLAHSPDISIRRRSNPRPFEKFVKEDGTGVQYKLYSSTDYSKYKLDEERPKI